MDSEFNVEKLKQDEPLSKHTTLGIGGPAEFFYEVNSATELVGALKYAKQQDLPVTVLGRGSNVLIADRGIKGLVIKNRSRHVQIGNEIPTEQIAPKEQVQYRWDAFEDESGKATFQYEFKDLDYDESDADHVEVMVESGVDLPFLIHDLINKGITGLQWYAGIPCTVGGAVYNNLHGGTHHIAEVVDRVEVIDEDFNIYELNHDDLAGDYDESRFHDTKETILKVYFHLPKGDTERAKYTAMEWSKRKWRQPRKTPGCTFANISNEQKERLGYPSTSMGYIVENILELSAYQVGEAAVSTKHHNFIENLGNATAADYLAVMKKISSTMKQKLGFAVRPEIFLLGFEPDEIKELYELE